MYVSLGCTYLGILLPCTEVNFGGFHAAGTSNVELPAHANVVKQERVRAKISARLLRCCLHTDRVDKQDWRGIDGDLRLARYQARRA